MIVSLYITSEQGRVAVTRQLLGAGANLELCTNVHGWSPLFVAAWNGYAAFVEFLLASGADPTRATTAEHLSIGAGTTAESVAEAKGHRTVLAAFRRKRSNLRPRLTSKSHYGFSF